MVYTPAGYSSSQKYPVLYLLHGISGNETHWPGPGAAAAILDSLIAYKKAVPMIVVMPHGRSSNEPEISTSAYAAAEARAAPQVPRCGSSGSRCGPGRGGQARAGRRPRPVTAPPAAAAARRWLSSSRRTRRSSASCWLI